MNAPGLIPTPAGIATARVEKLKRIAGLIDLSGFLTPRGAMLAGMFRTAQAAATSLKRLARDGYLRPRRIDGLRVSYVATARLVAVAGRELPEAPSHPDRLKEAVQAALGVPLRMGSAIYCGGLAGRTRVVIWREFGSVSSCRQAVQQLVNEVRSGAVAQARIVMSSGAKAREAKALLELLQAPPQIQAATPETLKKEIHR